MTTPEGEGLSTRGVCNTPPTHHVEVGEGAEGAPEERACLDRLDPQGVGQQHAEYGDTLVVIGTSHRPGWVESPITRPHPPLIGY